MPGSDLSYCDLLGLKPDASQDEIRAAYDSLMIRIRPNVAQDSASTIRLAAAVKEAWETLGDADKRRAYDESLRGTAAYADIWRRSQQASLASCPRSRATDRAWCSTMGIPIESTASQDVLSSRAGRWASASRCASD